MWGARFRNFGMPGGRRQSEPGGAKATTMATALAALATLAISGCAADEAISTASVGAGNSAPPVTRQMVTAPPTSVAPPAPLTSCTPESLPTAVPGTLTFATGGIRTPSAPWFNDADPATGRGLQAAVARDLASTLGYSADRVRWVAGSNARADVTFPDPKLTGSAGSANSTATPATDKTVGYFAVNDALVVRGTARTSAPAAANIRLGFVTGTQSEWSARSYGAASALGFSTESQGLAALAAGRIDAMLVPLTSVTSLPHSLRAIGQVAPTGTYQATQLTMNLPPGSPLATCVNSALDRLRVEGTLAAEAQRWIALPILAGAR